MKFKSIAVDMVSSATHDTRDEGPKTYYKTRLVGVDLEGRLWYTDDDGDNWYEYQIGALHPLDTEG